MTREEHLAQVRRWLTYARSDLRAAERFLSDPEPEPWQACFHSQQAADKGLKAILVFLQVEFQKVHDLRGLAELIPAEWGLGSRIPALAELSVWAVEGRYPGDWPDATLADATEAVGVARAFLGWVLAEFPSRGCPTV
ncbi:MAG: HEPN domain-containing protein [Candidatus Sericytochromatia bacterium]|nr:HEPN domain-containing protein [Candidatus Tanganyikabacteria bacterium]